jgi:regulatory protein
MLYLGRVEMEYRKQHTITALTPQKKKPWQTSIFIDGEFWRSCNAETVVDLGLYENMQLDTCEYERLAYSLDKRHAFDRAVLLLSYRARSSHEICERLKQAGFSENTITDVISSLKRLGYIDDSAFSRSWAKSRMTSKLYGSKKIMQELKDKGIREEIINDVLADLETNETELDRARLLAIKRLPSLKGVDKETAFRRLGQFLIRRGYSGSIVYEVCNAALQSDDGDYAL